MQLEDVIDLAEAAESLGLAPVSLRSAVARGRFNARKVGGGWITTRQEVERYRQETLGRLGRPAGVASSPVPGGSGRHIAPPKGTAVAPKPVGRVVASK